MIIKSNSGNSFGGWGPKGEHERNKINHPKPTFLFFITINRIIPCPRITLRRPRRLCPITSDPPKYSSPAQQFLRSKTRPPKYSNTLHIRHPMPILFRTRGCPSFFLNRVRNEENYAHRGSVSNDLSHGRDRARFVSSHSKMRKFRRWRKTLEIAHEPYGLVDLNSWQSGRVTLRKTGLSSL